MYANSFTLKTRVFFWRYQLMKLWAVHTNFPVWITETLRPVAVRKVNFRHVSHQKYFYILHFTIY